MVEVVSRKGYLAAADPTVESKLKERTTFRFTLPGKAPLSEEAH